jgi:hypothetical protein
MFYGQCWKCGERWNLGTASTCTCEPEQPQRPWVGLTQEEKHAIRYSHMTSAEFIEFIEAKLKQKNGYAEEKNT